MKVGEKMILVDMLHVSLCALSDVKQKIFELESSTEIRNDLYKRLNNADDIISKVRRELLET